MNRIFSVLLVTINVEHYSRFGVKTYFLHKYLLILKSNQITKGPDSLHTANNRSVVRSKTKKASGKPVMRKM